jgi:hypothetical protein
MESPYLKRRPKELNLNDADISDLSECLLESIIELYEAYSKKKTNTVKDPQTTLKLNYFIEKLSEKCDKQQKNSAKPTKTHQTSDKSPKNPLKNRGSPKSPEKSPDLSQEYKPPQEPEKKQTSSSDTESNQDNIFIIQDRITAAEIEKDQIEAMLQQVRNSIEGMNSLEHYSEENRKPNLEDNNIPLKIHQESHKKNQLTSERLKKFREDQRDRENTLAKKLEKIQKQIEYENQMLLIQQEKQKEIKNEEYKAELEKMKEKKLKRKKELEDIKKRQQDLVHVQTAKPLYIKLEEKYKKELEMHQKNLELAEKAKIMSPVRQEDIQKHAKWYKEVKNEHKKQLETHMQSKIINEKFRSSSHGLTSLGAKIIEEDKKLKIELNRASQERLNMIEKKTRYANLVREMFIPTIERLKKQENTQKNFEKKSYSSRSPAREDKIVVSDTEAKKKNKVPKKIKDNPLIPKPPPKKEIKVIDFLEERRKNRQEEEEEKKYDPDDLDWKKDLETDLPDHEKAKILKKKAKMLEKEARKQELLIGTNSINAKSLKQSESVNELLLSSIKAKLAALDHKNN